MNRDVADLLKCLPDRRFPYRIFDAASGRVLRSVSGDDATSDDSVMAAFAEPSPLTTPPPVLEIVELRRLISEAPQLDDPRIPTEHLPRMIEVPPSTRGSGNIASAPLRSGLGAGRPGTTTAAAVAAKVTGEPQPRDPQADGSTRSLLAALRAPRERASSAVRVPSTAHVLSALTSGAPTFRVAARPSTAQVLGALAPNKSSAEPAAAPQTAGRIASLLGARSEVAANRASGDSSTAPRDGSTASMLRGVLRR